MSVTRDGFETAVWLQVWTREVDTTWIPMKPDEPGIVVVACLGVCLAGALRDAAGPSQRVVIKEETPDGYGWFVTDLEGPGVRVTLVRDCDDHLVLHIVQARHWNGCYRLNEWRSDSISMSRQVARDLAKKIEELLGEGSNGASETTAPTGEAGIAQVG